MSENDSKINIDPTIPVAYREKRVEFFGRPFFIDPNVLIPRFETEELVRIALRKHTEAPFDALVDCGTGSGIILISTLAEIKTRALTPIMYSFGTDISAKSLKIARTNAKNLDISPIFMRWNLLTPIETISLPHNISILILANLPYIKNNDQENMSADTIHEPELALYGGPKTGFELYEKFFAQAEKFFEKKAPKSLTIIAEIGFDQAQHARNYLSHFSGKTEILNDLTGTPRFILHKIAQ